MNRQQQKLLGGQRDLRIEGKTTEHDDRDEDDDE